MKKVILGTKVPAKLWLNDVEPSCLEQIVNRTFHNPATTIKLRVEEVILRWLTIATIWA